MGNKRPMTITDLCICMAVFVVLILFILIGALAIMVNP